MNTEEDTIRYLKRTPLNEMSVIFDNWFVDSGRLPVWEELLIANHWTFYEWNHHG